MGCVGLASQSAVGMVAPPSFSSDLGPSDYYTMSSSTPGVWSLVTPPPPETAADGVYEVAGYRTYDLNAVFDLSALPTMTLAVFFPAGSRFKHLVGIPPLALEALLPGSIESITATFSGHSCIRTVSHGGCLDYVGPYVFAKSSIETFDCDRLRRVGEGAFSECPKLSTIRVSNVVDIGMRACAGCVSLRQVECAATIEPELTDISTIDYQAFSDCRKLAAFVLPSHLSTIGNAAFYGCSSLSGFDDEATLTFFGTNIYVDSLPPTISKLMWPSILYAATEKYRGADPSTLNLTVLPVDAVRDIRGPVALGLPHSNLLTPACIDNLIPDYSTNWPTKVVEFSRDHKLTVRRYPYGVKELTLPTAVTAVGRRTFHGSHIKRLTAPGVREIGRSAFQASHLETIDCGALSAVGNEAFSASSLATTPAFAVGCTIGHHAFTRTQIGPSLTLNGATIDNFAFMENPALISVTLIGCSLDVAVFHKCEALARARLENTGISRCCFSHCHNLASVDCFSGPSHLTEHLRTADWNFVAASDHNRPTISQSAFEFAGTEVKRPISVLADGAWAFDTAFRYSGIGTFCGTFYGESIPIECFGSCHRMHTVHLNSNITKIGSSAFAGSSIEKLVWQPRRAEPPRGFSRCFITVGPRAFASCSCLESITLCATNVGKSAFANCGSLRHVRLLAPVAQIKSYAFSDCPELESVVINISASLRTKHQPLKLEPLLFHNSGVNGIEVAFRVVSPRTAGYNGGLVGSNSEKQAGVRWSNKASTILTDNPMDNVDNFYDHIVTDRDVGLSFVVRPAIRLELPPGSPLPTPSGLLPRPDYRLGPSGEGVFSLVGSASATAATFRRLSSTECIRLEPQLSLPTTMTLGPRLKLCRKETGFIVWALLRCEWSYTATTAGDCAKRRQISFTGLPLPAIDCILSMIGPESVCPLRKSAVWRPIKRRPPFRP